MAPEVETHLVNAVLTNGARYYVDHAHPEYSTPECADALELVRFDKAGERILARSIEAAADVLPPGQEIVVYKNNSDRKGNSYGCHENYLMDRAVPFARVVHHVMPHFVSRQIYTGAGKVGSEAPGISSTEVPFQLTQRADFFEEEVGLETTLKRPLVNTRDEPHSDSQKYRRLHVIVGDANLAEVSTFLKVGITAIVLAMIEDDELHGLDLSLAHPVPAHRQVSYDLSLARPLELADGRRMTALEMQWEYARPGPQVRREPGPGGRRRRGRARWCSTAGSRCSPPWRPIPCRSPASSTGWPSSGWSRPTRSATAWAGTTPSWPPSTCSTTTCPPDARSSPACGLERLTTEDEVVEAITEPPTSTRAYFRGRCLQRWGSSIAAANWDSLVFDLGSDPLRRVPMMEPLRGTAAHVDSLFEACEPRPSCLRPWVRRRRSPAMPEREQKRKATTSRTEEVVEELPAQTKQGEKLKAELDDLLDEIDEVLEDNAEEFVRSYVQKGGQ